MATKATWLDVLARRRQTRVLLAEDNSELRWLFARTLQRAGFELVEAASGDEALERIADQLLEDEEAFDLVIADARMAGFAALDLVACLRHFDWHTPVILISPCADAATLHEADRLGVFAVFDKPFDLDDLEAAILCAAP